MTLLNDVVKMRFSEALGWALFHSLWEGLIIAVALATLLAFVRSPRIRYVTGYVALLAILASLVITLITFLPEHHSNGRTPTATDLLRLKELPVMNRVDDRGSDWGSLIPWLCPVWLVGVCLFYLRYVAGWLSVYRLRRRGICNVPESWQRAVKNIAFELKISKPVTLLESLLADTPAVLGHFRPVILVPLGFLASLPPDQVEAILLHELSHIRRSDYFMNVCQRLIEGLLFYHPAVWWISRLIRTERENCCDDIVVKLRGDAHGYAAALTTLEQNRLEKQRFMHEPAVATTGGDLMKRVKRLLYPEGPSGIWAPAFSVVVFMASAAMMLTAWQTNPDPQQKNALDPWQRWLKQDVVYIISDEEEAAFERLKTDEDRQQFVEQFWARRDPTPSTPENEFKQEHYRRIGYANEHYASNLPIPGWKTDRGRIYIMYGPPDEIESHPAGGSYERPRWEGGGYAITVPFEDWRYRHFQGVGSLSIEFVDSAMSGEYRIALDPNEKYKKP